MNATWGSYVYTRFPLNDGYTFSAARHFCKSKGQGYDLMTFESLLVGAGPLVHVLRPNACRSSAEVPPARLATALWFGNEMEPAAPASSSLAGAVPCSTLSSNGTRLPRLTSVSERCTLFPASLPVGSLQEAC